ncbi:hypothetical protein BKA62DRAFT_696392 [Auriculariales sp. MPI-PUGE-AT-0066]|nr:hypothetical protein BKA62DRAFT_696392 [Auriculariales sp. MPI-PUGE-AT-0066]
MSCSASGDRCAFESVPDVLGLVCIQCGTVKAGTDDVLVSSKWDGGTTALVQPSVVRGAYNPSDAREARTKTNSTATHDFVRCVARFVGVAAGRAEDAIVLFDQAFRTGEFRWGRSSRYIACACLVLALRQAGIHHALYDIAVRADLKPWFVARAIFRIQDVLNLQFDRERLQDPSLPLPVLHQHMLNVAAVKPSPLPAKCATELLKSPPNDDTFRLASALAQMPSLPTCELPGITAATILNWHPLINILAAKEGLGKKRIIQHYHDMVNYLERRVALIPWYSASSAKRADVVGRDRDRELVARALPDLIKFDNSITRTLQQPANPRKRKRVSDIAASQPPLSPPPSNKIFLARRPRVSPWLRLKQLAAGALLDHPTALADDSIQELHKFMMNCTDAQLASSHVAGVAGPSRLQRLVAQYGGADGVPDSDLFDDGEMDAYLREDPEERDSIWRLRGEDWSHVSERARLHEKGDLPLRKKRKVGGAGAQDDPPPRSKIAGDWQTRLDASLGRSAPSQPNISFHEDDDDEEDEEEVEEDEETHGSDAALGFEDAYRWDGEYGSDNEDYKVDYNAYFMPPSGLERWLDSDSW